MIDVNELDITEIYKNVFGLLSKESITNNVINNVHSVDVDKTSNNRLNISMEYDNDYIVYISIDNDGISIEAPSNKAFNYIKGIIISEYPEYIDLIN